MNHSFKEVCNANGNITVEFKEDGKTRRIIFQYGTSAHIHYKLAIMHFRDKQYPTTDDMFIALIKRMRTSYRFTVNPNNVSIFRPIAKY